MNKKYTIIVVILFVIVCAVLIAFAITSNGGQRIKLLENAELFNRIEKICK